MCFQLTPRSMTWCGYNFEFSWNYAGFRKFGSQQRLR